MGMIPSKNMYKNSCRLSKSLVSPRLVSKIFIIIDTSSCMLYLFIKYNAMEFIKIIAELKGFKVFFVKIIEKTTFDIKNANI